MISRRFVSDLTRRVMRPHQREDGQVIIMVGLATIVLFAVVGLAVDVGRMYIMKAELSRAMDAAALAGVLELPDTTKAKLACEEYLLKNEPNVLPVGGAELCTSPGENTLQVRGRKEITMFFVRVLGIDDAGVTAKAKAGFGVAFLDAALVIDATGSMDDSCTTSSQNNSGCEIWEAKNAAKAFKDVLLGPAPDGNTVIGATAFRGCFRANPTTATAPMNLTAKDLCVRHDSTTSTWVTPLTSSKTTLDSRINNIMATGGSGTNVCGGLAKGWEILDGPGNHLGQQNALRYVVLLSDGDNNYYGHYTYQASLASPHTYRGYSCQPPSSCSNVGGDTSSSPECHSGTYTALTDEASDTFGSSSSSTLASEDFPSSGCTSYGWNGGTGWSGNWSLSGTASPVTQNSVYYNTNCALGLQGSGAITRQVNLSSASSPTLNYRARRGATWESDDRGYAQAATSSGGPWTTLQTHTSSLGTGFTSFTPSLSAFAGQSTVYIRFLADTDASTEYFYVDAISITSTSCSNWNAGSGWAGAWTLSPASGNDMPAIVTTSSPADGSCHAQLRGVGTITRSLDLSGVSSATLTYYAKYNSWESGDNAVVSVSTNGTTWTPLRDHTTSNTTTSNQQFTSDLSPYTGGTVYIRFEGSMTANATDDQFFVDLVEITSGATGGATGYLNGQDDSSATCDDAAARERQLDMQTLALAQAMEADGVEIYVVGFGTCSPNSTIFTDAQCQPYTVSGGLIGNADHDNTADQRLAKCIASSKVNTNDHYFYASSASALPAIFTQIAKQIAHRLIE